MSLLTKLRVVIDSNVLISGLIWGGNPGTVIKKWRSNSFILLISPFILAELVNFLEQHGIGDNEKEVIVNEFQTGATKVIPSRKVDICRDKKDNQVLDLCLAGKADYLVTGDKDLLVLKELKKTKIASPKEFIEIIFN